MEDSKNLIDELLAKLGELDSKVASYRQEMLDQFKKLTDDLLKDVPEDVSNEVSRVIAESMAKYPSLSMPSRVEPDSPATPSVTEPKPSREGRKSPPPILYHTSGIPKMFRAGPRSPHDREFEFQGLFTPSYLPLLDGNDRPPKVDKPDKTAHFRKPNTPDPEGASPFDSLLAPQAVRTDENDDEEEGPSVEMVEEVEVTPDTDTKGKGKGKEVVRPSPAREPTDISISSSVGSSSSEQKTRRSALRRSSSSVRGSPRRVRFEFEGTEVLPTASPQPSESVLGTLGGLNLNAPESSTPAIGDSENFTGPSLSDVEGEEDSRPRPARISSTEALRRLSRTPSDDGTVWNVVNPSNETSLPYTNGHGSDERDSAATSSNAEATSVSVPNPTSTQMSAEGEYQPQRTAAINGIHIPYHLTTPATTAGKRNDDDSSEEEQFLAIRSPKKSPSPTGPATHTLSSEPRSQITEEAPAASPSSKAKGKDRKIVPVEHIEEEDLFDFEDPANPVTGSAAVEKYIPEDDEEAEPAAVQTSDAAAPAPLNLYSTSPAVSIPQRKTPSPPTVIAGSSTNKRFNESIGSYKGAPLRMSVVTDSEAVRKAAAMGDVKTYVGSVHGRTGVDPADESSYRASFSNARVHSGTPRSFSERMMMEEAMGQPTGQGQAMGQGQGQTGEDSDLD